MVCNAIVVVISYSTVQKSLAVKENDIHDGDIMIVKVCY